MIVLKPKLIGYFLLLAAAVILAVVFSRLDGGAEKAAETLAQGGAVLIIDAGHGGEDGGAVSVRGVTESAINLDIALKMRAIAELTGTKCVLTRESEDIEYPASAGTVAQRKVYDQKHRVELINSIPNAVLISVHQNKYTTPQPRGPQAFYGKVEPSGDLALIAQEMLNAMLYPQNRRVAAPVPTSVYIFKKTNCPALLAECGFLSNEEEAWLLEQDAHQLKTALALMGAYFKFMDTQR